MTFEELVQIEARKARKQGREEGKCMVIKTLLESQEPEKVAELLKISVDEVKAVIAN